MKIFDHRGEAGKQKSLLFIVPAVVFALVLLSSFINSQAKKYPFDLWKAEELARANTAKDVTYLTENEKQVIYYTNLARINPKLFSETYAQRYIDSTGEADTYTRSLMATLRKQSPLAALKPDALLSAAAAAHAEASGKKGITGHAGDDKRSKQANEAGYKYWGENCCYGDESALENVMQLLIDQDIANLGHRKNMLNENYTHLGTAVRVHKKYEWNCVQDFGGVGK
jgi:uncharacterized protein YkwD